MTQPKHIVYDGNGTVRGVFDRQHDASEFARSHNLENDNWKSINTKWWMQSWPAHDPVPGRLS